MPFEKGWFRMEEVGYCNCPSITYFCLLCDRRAYSHIYWERDKKKDGNKFNDLHGSTRYRVVQPTMHYGNRHVHGNCLALMLAQRFDQLCNVMANYVSRIDNYVKQITETYLKDLNSKIGENNDTTTNRYLE